MGTEDVYVQEGFWTYFARIEVWRVVLGEDFSFRHVGVIGLVLGKAGERKLHGWRGESFEKMPVGRK